MFNYRLVKSISTTSVYNIRSVFKFPAVSAVLKYLLVNHSISQTEFLTAFLLAICFQYRFLFTLPCLWLCKKSNSVCTTTITLCIRKTLLFAHFEYVFEIYLQRATMIIVIHVWYWLLVLGRYQLWHNSRLNNCRYAGFEECTLYDQKQKILFCFAVVGILNQSEKCLSASLSCD